MTSLAGALGVSVSTISNWAHGRRPIPRRHYFQIENIIGQRLEEVKEGKSAWARAKNVPQSNRIRKK